jgi:proprotein convertase subtilisin/kexin type 5
VGSPSIQNKIRDIVVQDAGFVVENGQIRLCTPGCSYCVNPTICSTCSTGYVLNTVTSTCIRCAPLCTKCTETDTINCLTCVPGYFPVTTDGIVTCNRCHDSCVTCTGSSANACTSCKIGSYLDSTTYSCKDCIKNCISCTAGAVNLCDICKPGHVYNQNTRTCVKCIAGCAVCNPNQIYSCISCGFGFEPVLNANNVVTQCKICPPRCKNCTSGNCIECRPGFRLVNNNCTEQCRLPCK